MHPLIYMISFQSYAFKVVIGLDPMVQHDRNGEMKKTEEKGHIA
jgi:hypothetical protein